MTKADDVYLEDITENTLDFAPEVADSLGMSLSKYLKLPLPKRIDLTEKFLWQKKQGGFVNGYQSEGTVKTDDKQEAINFLTNTAKDAAKGLAEESEVYRIAENIVDDNKALFGTVNAILNKELGISFDVGKDKEVGFMLNPEEKKAQLGFKMSFQPGGEIGFLPEEIKKLTVWDATNDRIARLTNEYNAGQITKSSLDEAKLTKARLFGLKHNNVQYTNVIELTFGKNAKEILLVDFNTPSGQKNLYKTSLEQGAGNGKLWFKGQPGAAAHFRKNVSSVIGDQKLGYNAAAAIKDSDAMISQGKIIGAGSRGPIMTEEIYQQTAKQIENIKDLGAKNLAKLMLTTGIRRDDLIRLTAADINLEAKTITPTSFKGAPSRTIPLSDTAVSILKNQMNLNQYDQIFYKGGIKNLGDHYGKHINKALNKIRIEDNVQKLTRNMTLEDLRRSFMSRADALGVPEEVIDRLVGHTTKGTKRKYTLGKTTTALGIDENILKHVTKLEADLYGQLRLTSQEAINTFSGGQRAAITTLGQQVEEITQPKIQSQPITEERIPVETKKSIVQERIAVPEEIETKATKAINGEEIVSRNKKGNSESIKLALEKAGKTGKYAALMTLLSKIGKAATVLAPIEPLQVVNQLLGGEEGLYKGKLFGIFEPTITKDLEARKELLGVNQQEKMPE